MTVVAFIALILLCNICVFILVLIQIRRMKVNKPSEDSRVSLRDLRAAASLTVLLGLTWITAFFSFGPQRVLLIYPFAICNSLQGTARLAVGCRDRIFTGNLQSNVVFARLYLSVAGLFIFVFHCLMNENVRKQWRAHLGCRRDGDYSGKCALTSEAAASQAQQMHHFSVSLHKVGLQPRQAAPAKRNSQVKSDSVESDSTTVRKISDSSTGSAATRQDAA